MNQVNPLIFISNDDGIQAKGINELINILRPLGELCVVAPDGGRSGASSSITSDRPITYSLYNKQPGLSVYTCSGSPVDCTKLGLDRIVSRMPDLVVSGINHGDNASVNVHYSGTMGVAIEGCLKGIPSIGFSLCSMDKDADFQPIARFVTEIVKKVLRESLPPFVCLNVNFPATPMLKGLKVCKMAYGRWGNEWVKHIHPHGGDYYWLTGEYTNLNPEDDQTDEWALEQGFAALTPIKVDVTAYDAISLFKDLEQL